MLDRNKIAKQFELVVQQEIKNHNDQMLATNLALNLMHQKIAEQEKKAFFETSGILDRIKKLEAKNESLEKQVSIEIGILSSQKEAINKQSNRHSKLIEDIIVNIEELSNDISSILHKLNSLFSENIETKKIVDNVLQSVSCMFDTWDLRIKKEFANFKQEIEDRPSEIENLKLEFTQKINENTLDVCGIMREIQHYKKSAFVIEKKIENIYTLIKRLQDGET